MGLNISIEDKSGKKILHVEGRLDATSSPLLEERLSELIANNELHLLIDFSKVDYLSSAGMRLMLSNTKKQQAKKGSLVFYNLSEDVMEIIKMAGFEKILSIYPSEEDALASS